MTSTQHFLEAERLLEQRRSGDGVTLHDPSVHDVARAQAHLLAVIAATLLERAS